MTAVLSTGFNTRLADGDLSRLDTRLKHMTALGCTGAEITAVGQLVTSYARYVRYVPAQDGASSGAGGCIG